MSTNAWATFGRKFNVWNYKKSPNLVTLPLMPFIAFNKLILNKFLKRPSVFS